MNLPYRHRATIRERQNWGLSVVVALALTSVLIITLAVWVPFSPMARQLFVLSGALKESSPELVVVESNSTTVLPHIVESPPNFWENLPLLDSNSGDNSAVSVELSNKGLTASPQSPPAVQRGGWDTASAPGAGDPFNSPGGGLARPRQFQGEKLLVWTNEPYVINEIFSDDNPLWGHLDRMGFQVHRVSGRFDARDLRDANQVWVFAGFRSGMVYDDYRAVEEFVRDGGGLYLCSDNDPYFAESLELCRRLFGCRVRGDYRGQQLLGVLGEQGRQPAILGPRGRSKIAASNWQRPHGLLTGIRCIYEGDTISTITKSKYLTTVLRASNGQILAAVGKRDRRVCIDGGFTRYFPTNYRAGTEQGAGTALWATNVAAYLGGTSLSTHAE